MVQRLDPIDWPLPLPFTGQYLLGASRCKCSAANKFLSAENLTRSLQNRKLPHCLCDQRISNTFSRYSCCVHSVTFLFLPSSSDSMSQLHSYCYHAQVLGTTLVHEFSVLHSQTDRNLITSLCEKHEKFWKRKYVLLD